MSYGYKIPRLGVVLPDVPFTWNTNLEDGDLLDLYLLIRNDPDIMGTSAEIGVISLMSISLRVFDKFIEFKDGACHCIGVDETIYAIYKTAPEWTVWAAHQQESKELREEQVGERQADRMLVWAEIRYLIAKCTENLNNGNFDKAFRYLCGRVDLMRKYGIWWDRAEENMRISGFPIAYCIRYLNEYAHAGGSYVDLAGAIALWRGAINTEDAEELFQAAIFRFPTDGMLFKSICLFWERRGDSQHALRYCDLALSQQLTDDTKGGFGSRIKRLKKVAAHSVAPLLSAQQTKPSEGAR